jgi:hypothetical protein
MNDEDNNHAENTPTQQDVPMAASSATQTQAENQGKSWRKL